MVCKEEIYSWFRETSSSQRIDLMCNLLHLCLPFELRFAGSFLEDLARKHSARLHDFEAKANDAVVYATIEENDVPPSAITDRANLYTLNVYVALLHSDNARCANRVYVLVTQIWERLNIQLATASEPAGFGIPSSLDPHFIDDLILLMTMAALHPAFVYSQRVELFEILTKVQRIRHDMEIMERNAKCSRPIGKDVSRPMQQNEAVMNNVSQIIANEDELPVERTVISPCEVHVYSVELKQRNTAKQEYLLRATWSDGTTAELVRSFKHLKEFSEEVTRIIDEFCLETICSLPSIPRFPSDEVSSPSRADKFPMLLNYFRELCDMPAPFISDARLTRAIRNLIEVNVSPSSSIQSDGGRTSLRPPYVPLSSVLNSRHVSQALNVSSSSDSKRTEISHGIRSEKTGYSLPTSSQSTTCTSYERMIRLDNSLNDTSETGSNPSPVTSSRSSPYLMGGTTDRSRRNSLHGGDGTLGGWLKDIRLHKYTDNLSKYTWDQLLALSDADLREEGFTSGARKKFRQEVESRAARLKQEGAECFTPPDCLQSPEGSTASSFCVRHTSGIGSSIITYATPISSPGSGADMDSSCSEYSTPPGSPDGVSSHVCGRRSGRSTGGQRHAQRLANNIGKVVDGGCETECWAWSHRTSVTDPPLLDSVSPPILQDSPHLTVLATLTTQGSSCSMGTTAPAFSNSNVTNLVCGLNTATSYSSHINMTSPPLGGPALMPTLQFLDLNGSSQTSFQNGQVPSAHWHTVTVPPMSTSSHAINSRIHANTTTLQPGYSFTSDVAYDARSIDSAADKTICEHEIGAARVGSLVGLLPTPRPGEPSGFGQRYLMPADAVLVRPRLPLGPPPPLTATASGISSNTSSQPQFADFQNHVASCASIASTAASETAVVYSTPAVIYAGATPMSHQFLFPPPPPAKSVAGVNLLTGIRGDFIDGSTQGVIPYMQSTISFDQWNIDSSSNAGGNSVLYFQPRYYPMPPSFSMNPNQMWGAPYGSNYPPLQGPPPPNQGIGMAPFSTTRMMSQGLPPPLMGSQLPPHMIGQLPPQQQHSSLVGGPAVQQHPAPMMSMISQVCGGNNGNGNVIQGGLSSSNNQSADEDDDMMHRCRHCGQIVTTTTTQQSAVTTPAGGNSAAGVALLYPTMPVPSTYNRPPPGLNMPVNAASYIGGPPPLQAPPPRSFRPMSSMPPTASQTDVCPPNGINREFRFPAAYPTGCHGSRPPTQTSFAVPPLPPTVNCRPPLELTCSGCGGAGHRFLDCKESTGDTLQGVFHLKLTAKSEIE